MVKGMMLFLVVMAVIGLLSNALAPGSVARLIRRRAGALAALLSGRRGRG